MSGENISLRAMMNTDWSSVREIYEQGISTGKATFETTAPGWDDWNDSHLTFGRWVALEGDNIVGWAALSSVTDRCVYSGVAEVSVYVRLENGGKGIGLKLLNQVIQESEEKGVWTINAAMFPENAASIALHKKAGFREIGYREKIAQIRGEWKDNILMERRSKKVGMAVS